MRGRFLERPNRFVVRVELADGERIEAHLADPGRMVELLRPGAELRLRPVAAAARRRTRFTVVLVRSPSPSAVWVSLEPARANDLAERLIRENRLRGLAPRNPSGRDPTLRREVTAGRSRFDFRLDWPGAPPLWIEVKSVTLVVGRTALFPDAPTARGARHLRELEQRVAEGDRAWVLFVVQRGDVNRLRAHRELDPEFARTLQAAARRGVRVRGVGFRYDS